MNIWTPNWIMRAGCPLCMLLPARQHNPESILVKLGRSRERNDTWKSIPAYPLLRWVKCFSWPLHWGNNFNKGTISLSIHSLTSSFHSQLSPTITLAYQLRILPLGLGKGLRW